MSLTKCYTGSLTRVYPSELVQALDEAGLTYAPYPLQREVMRPILRAAVRQGRDDLTYIPAGQSTILAKEEPI